MVKQQVPESYLEKIAIGFTEWVGSISSLIVHTILFAVCFVSVLFGVPFEKMLLVLTTVVSLEAIYLAIFIQMTVNRNTASLEEVEEDIDEIQKDIDEVQEDVGEIAEDVEEVQKDVDEIQADIDEVQKDVEDITEGETAEQHRDRVNRESLDKIENTLARLIGEIEKIKAQK
jgi:septal ring factor EnvC (AmiA/AmiB activator)